MKRFRCWFVSTVFFISLFWGTTAIAQTDLLNLSAYAEGSSVPYGENMVVVQDEETGEKWITPLKETSGRLNIPVNLPSESFEVILEIHGISENEKAEVVEWHGLGGVKWASMPILPSPDVPQMFAKGSPAAAKSHRLDRRSPQ